MTSLNFPSESCIGTQCRCASGGRVVIVIFTRTLSVIAPRDVIMFKFVIHFFAESSRCQANERSLTPCSLSMLIWCRLGQYSGSGGGADKPYNVCTHAACDRLFWFYCYPMTKRDFGVPIVEDRRTLENGNPPPVLTMVYNLRHLNRISSLA